MKNGLARLLQDEGWEVKGGLSEPKSESDGVDRFVDTVDSVDELLLFRGTVDADEVRNLDSVACGNLTANVGCLTMTKFLVGWIVLLAPVVAWCFFLEAIFPSCWQRTGVGFLVGGIWGRVCGVKKWGP